MAEQPVLEETVAQVETAALNLQVKLVAAAMVAMEETVALAV